MATNKAFDKMLERFAKKRENELGGEEQTSNSSLTNAKVITLPKGQTELNILTVSGLYLGDPYRTLKVRKLIQNIEEINKDPNGVFVIGGNLFFYVSDSILYLAKRKEIMIPGVTKAEHEKYIWPDSKADKGVTEDMDLSAKKEKKYQNIREFLMNKALADAVRIFKLMDPKKIVAIYPGSDDRYMHKYAWELSKKLAIKLNCKDKYFDKGCAIDFVFNNDWTENKDEVFSTVFNHNKVIPNSQNYSTANNLLSKLNNAEKGKQLIVETGSPLAFATTAIDLLPTSDDHSIKQVTTKVAVPGYAEVIGKSHDDKYATVPYTTDNFKLTLSVSKVVDVSEIVGAGIIDAGYRKVVQFKEFGLENQKEIDDNFELWSQMNAVKFYNRALKEEIEAIADQARQQVETNLISSLIKNNQKKSEKKNSVEKQETEKQDQSTSEVESEDTAETVSDDEEEDLND